MKVEEERLEEKREGNRREQKRIQGKGEKEHKK